MGGCGGVGFRWRGGGRGQLCSLGFFCCVIVWGGASVRMTGCGCWGSISWACDELVRQAGGLALLLAGSSEWWAVALRFAGAEECV